MASLLRQRCQVSIRQLGSLRPGRAPSGSRIWAGRRLAADFSAPKPPPPPPPSRGLLRRYTTLLETRPLTTKAVTAAILGFLGDAVAQLGVQVQLGVDPKQLTFDVKRSAIFTSFAAALAPVLHFWWVYSLGRPWVVPELFLDGCCSGSLYVLDALCANRVHSSV